MSVCLFVRGRLYLRQNTRGFGTAACGAHSSQYKLAAEAGGFRENRACFVASLNAALTSNFGTLEPRNFGRLLSNKVFLLPTGNPEAVERRALINTLGRGESESGWRKR